MPTFPLTAVALRTQGNAMSNKFVDFAGRERSSRFEASSAATSGQLDAVRDAIGEASNAALVASERILFDEILNPAGLGVVTFDEAYPSVGDVAVMFFVNGTGDQVVVEIPAPDASLFNDTDYETVNVEAGSLGAAIVAAVLPAINAGTVPDNYVFARGFYSKRKTKRIASRTKPGVFREPNAGESPPEEPGI